MADAIEDTTGYGVAGQLEQVSFFIGEALAAAEGMGRARRDGREVGYLPAENLYMVQGAIDAARAALGAAEGNLGPVGLMANEAAGITGRWERVLGEGDMEWTYTVRRVRAMAPEA